MCELNGVHFTLDDLFLLFKKQKVNSIIPFYQQEPAYSYLKLVGYDLEKKRRFLNYSNKNN